MTGNLFLNDFSMDERHCPNEKFPWEVEVALPLPSPRLRIFLKFLSDYGELYVPHLVTIMLLYHYQLRMTE
jgi:hypothetical protein